MVLLKRHTFSKFDFFWHSFIINCGLILTIIFFLWWFQSRHIPYNFTGKAHIVDYFLFAILSYIVWHQIINELFSWYISFFMHDPGVMEAESGKHVAFCTAFVPGTEPYDMLEHTLKAMVDVDYPHDTWLLDEGDDGEAKRISMQLGVHHFTRRNTPEYNLNRGPYRVKTKGGNYNAWFDKHGKHYDFVAQVDVDFQPKKNFLTRTLGYFRNPDVAFVGTPQIYGNQSSSWIARGAAEQAFNFYGHIQRGLFFQNMTLFIGANHIVRVKAMQSIGGYSGHIVEDHLTGMHYYASKWKSVYVPEILAIGEGPATWSGYFSQQMRWAYGLIDILIHHTPRLLFKLDFVHSINYLLLQQYYFDGFAQILGIILLILFFFFGFEATSMELRELLILFGPLLLIQVIVAFWMQKFFIHEDERGWQLYGKFLSIAAWPIYALAFFKVLTGMNHTYKVTPKGKAQQSSVSIQLFLPHIILGTITLMCLVAAIFTGYFSIQLAFFAALNTFLMYMVVFVSCYTIFEDYAKRVLSLVFAPFTLPLKFLKR